MPTSKLANRTPKRTLRFEGLEARQMLTVSAGPPSDTWPRGEEQQVASAAEFGSAVPDVATAHTNGALPNDVNADNKVTARDALFVINAVLLHGPGKASELASDFFLDVNADGNVSFVDAQAVIDTLVSTPLLATLTANEQVPGAALDDVPIATHPSQVAADCAASPLMPAVSTFDSASQPYGSGGPQAWLEGPRRRSWGDGDSVPRIVASTVPSAQSLNSAAAHLPEHLRSPKATPPLSELNPAAVDEVFGLMGSDIWTRDRLAAKHARA
jgi:hypothetical protein